MCWRKSGSRMELDPKKAQKAHLAGGQGGTWEGCSSPCRRGQLPPGNGGQARGWAHRHTLPGGQPSPIRPVCRESTAIPVLTGSHV